MSKQNKKKSSNNESHSDKSKDKNEQKDKAPKYGPMPTFPRQRIFTRIVIVFSTLLIVYFTSNKEKTTTFAAQKDSLTQRSQTVDCSSQYNSEMKNYPGCLPEKCGRFVTDKLVTGQETDVLLSLAKSVFAISGSGGGASILDLHSGALSYGMQFVNVYTLENAKKLFNPADFAIYKVVKSKIQHAISHNFGVDMDKIHLTHPTFFSKLTNSDPKTIHDEYWHIHVDKETYPSFHYTSLLYLNDFNIDFKGGRFTFTGSAQNSTIEPRRGRVLMFTSGAENPHFVERVTDGVRYALTVSFTCDQTLAIKDPHVKSKQEH